MSKQLLEELSSRIANYDHKLNLLLQKGGNDEKIVAKRKELLTQYFQLKKDGEKSITDKVKE